MKTVTKTDWQTSELPSQRSTVSLSRTFSPEEVQKLRQGVLPQAMEDKWFIYWQDDSLIFHRSWTGYCIYIVQFAIEGENCRMVEADLNRDPEQYKETDNNRDAQMISYLIDALLLRQDVPFPSEESDSDHRALAQWSQVGRAMLGQYPEHE
jgi:hypothetical protein